MDDVLKEGILSILEQELVDNRAEQELKKDEMIQKLKDIIEAQKKYIQILEQEIVSLESKGLKDE